MSPGRRVRTGLLATAWALVGVLGGHLVTYALLFPEAHVHDAVLRSSGHAWIGMLGPAALTAVAVAVALGLLGGMHRDHARGIRFTALVLIQVGLFASLEITERIASSGLTIDSLEHHLTGHGLAAILVLGAIVQVITAWLGSAVSRLVSMVAERLRPRPARRRLVHGQRVRIVALMPPSHPVRAHRVRGPPLSVALPVPIPQAA